VLALNALFLNGDHNEEKKRDPRLLEEEERLSAAFGDRPHQAAAAGAASSPAGEIRKAARNVDEVRTSRFLGASRQGPTRMIRSEKG
jgi:hypothetical protein